VTKHGEVKTIVFVLLTDENQALIISIVILSKLFVWLSSSWLVCSATWWQFTR